MIKASHKSSFRAESPAKPYFMRRAGGIPWHSPQLISRDVSTSLDMTELLFFTCRA
jgi:hypothetical protein